MTDKEMEKLKPYLKDAIIILEACQSGYGKNNIAEEIAGLTYAKKVIAPNKKTYVKQYVIGKDSNGNPIIKGIIYGGGAKAKNFSVEKNKSKKK